MMNLKGTQILCPEVRSRGSRGKITKGKRELGTLTVEHPVNLRHPVLIRSHLRLLRLRLRREQSLIWKILSVIRWAGSPAEEWRALGPVDKQIHNFSSLAKHLLPRHLNPHLSLPI